MGCGLLKHKNPRRKSEKVIINPGQFFTKNRGKMLNFYTEIKTLGCGAFAEVKLFHHTLTGTQRAIKIIHKVGLHQQQVDSNYTLKEINVLTSLDHPNILKCYEIFEDSWRFYVSMEYCEGGELFGKLVTMKQFNEIQAAQIMHQLLSAISYCHEKFVIHRDLKPENILLDDKLGELSIKIADFGSSCFLDANKKLSGCFGSAYYVAPEVLQNEYNEKCDIWSCGVILYILLTGKPPYPGRDSKLILNLVKTDPLKITPDKVANINLDCVDLLKKMLEINPKERISAKEAVNHPWIQNYKTQTMTADLSSTLSSLQKFHASVKMKDAVHIYLATQIISHDESKQLTQHFQLLDKNSDGRISKDELLNSYLEQMDEENAKVTVDKIMKEVDTNMSGDIDYSEFLLACLNYKKFMSKDNLNAAFRMFDRDGSGYITLDEIRDVLGKGTDLPNGAWEEILKDADSNGDGVIDLKEFVQLMTEKL